MVELSTKKFYMGDDIETLPRDKLMDVIDCLFNELESTRRTVRSMIELNKLTREVKRREQEHEKRKLHLFEERAKG